MTQMIVVFNEDASAAIMWQPHDADFEAGLVAQGIQHKILDFDPDNEYYWGDYATGGIRNSNEVPLVEEVAVDEVVNKTILSRYPVHKQLNIIAECFAAAGIPLTDDFTEMRNWINTKISNHNSAVQAYKDKPDVYSFNPKAPPALLED